MIKCCIIAAIGELSLHRKWITKSSRFDLHLIVYDGSYETFKSDSTHVTHAKGYKFKLIYDYLNEKPNIIDQYNYFYMPDDDILIHSAGIHKLFWYMKNYELAIAQPAIANSYYSHSHTLRVPNSKIRYTNFVEIMQPCFSQEALKQVLFTFNASRSGWGIDFHWGKILDFSKMNMAIIDDVVSIHTRPVQSNHHQDLTEYLNKYNLDREIYST